MATVSLLTSFVSTLAFGIGLASQAYGQQFPRPEDAVRYRQGVFFALGQHLSHLGAMVNGKITYDAKAAATDAEAVAALAKLPMAGFVPSTDKISPKVKPEAWAELPKLREMGEKMAAESAKMAASKAGDFAALKAAYAATASTCKSCHDAYKN